MRKIAIESVHEETYDKSPSGKFGGETVKEISLALGRQPDATDPLHRHPFDLSLVSLPPQSSLCPYHAHSVEWEMYIILGGTGVMRDEAGNHPVAAGDVILFAPGEAHQITNTASTALTYYIVADNPLADSCYYPDSDKWSVRVGGQGGIIKGRPADYYEGEDSL